MTATVQATPRRAGTAFVLVTVLLDTLGLGLLIPVAPRLVASFLHDDLAAASQYFGVIVSLYATMQFVSAPIIGGLSDHFGRRPVILLSLLGATISYLISAFAPALGWLFVGRTIAGITGASFSAAGAYVADVTPPEKRAQAFGMVGAVFGLGFILGPVAGGFLGDMGLRVPYFVAAALNFVNMIYGLVVLPESLPVANRRRFSFARANPLGALRTLGRHRVIRSLAGTMLCAFMAQWILQGTWALDTQARFGWSMGKVGMSLMISGIGMAVVQGGLVRVVVPRLGERRALVLGLVIGVIGQASLGLAAQGWIMMAILVPMSLAGLAGPSVQAIVSREVSAKEQGELQGAINSLNGLAAIFGPLLGTNLLAKFGAPDSSPRIPGSSFFAASAFNVLGLCIAAYMFTRSKADSARVPVPAASGSDVAPGG
jgi:DHA1 family tetracycline resistance protein-like MFS transporter